MEKKKVLDVGQCDPDHSSIRRMLSRFPVEIVRVHNAETALEALRRDDFALVLINRKLDHDYTDGLEIIRAMKASPEMARVPVMLVSNYPEYQAEAVAAGAEHGFGKSELGDAEVHERVAKFLAD